MADLIMRTYRRLLLLGFLFVNTLWMSWAHGAEVSREYSLKAGWNAVALDVDPVNSAPEEVFGGLPVEAVWCYFPTGAAVQFITDPGEKLFNVAGWNVWLPANRPDSFLSNLKTIQGGRSYLIKLASAPAQPLEVRGQPRFKAPHWTPDGFTLSALAVDDSSSLTFGDYFANSPAHRNQAVFRLAANGTWERVLPSSPIIAREAYWIFTKGFSSFLTPIEVDLAGRQVFAFGPLAAHQQLTVYNRAAYQVVLNLSNASALPLLAKPAAPNEQEAYAPFTSRNLVIPAGGSAAIAFGLDRSALTGPLDGLLLLNGAGYELTIPISAETESSPAVGAPSSAAPKRSLALAASDANDPDIGLWVGDVTLNKVSHHLAADKAAPLATPATFSFRLILHVDAAKQVRLLEQVWLMRKQSGDTYALVTDPQALANYKPATLKDGAAFSYRISSAAIDLPGLSVDLSGGFGGSLSGSFLVARNSPTNPFKHRYHPDHDDKDGQFKALPASLPPDKEEVFEVTRAIVLNFDPPTTDAEPGRPARTGTYRETLSGLHKDSIVVSGSFSLRRINLSPELNPLP